MTHPLTKGDLEYYDQLHTGCDAQREGNQPLPHDFPTDSQLLVRSFVAFMDDGDDGANDGDDNYSGTDGTLGK